MEIKRDRYLDALDRRKGNGLIKIIAGIRRCGKSYLLNKLFYDKLLSEGVPKNRIIRFAFDSADDLSMIGEDIIEMERENRRVNPEKFLQYLSGRTDTKDAYYLLLDEVQLLDCFEAVLNGYLRKDNLDVFVTGSNAKFLSSDIVTEFAGRGDVIRMYPLSFAEFMSIYKGDKYEGLTEYMTYGGIPSVVLRGTDSEKANMLETLLDEIYLRDIMTRNRIRNREELEELLNILSSDIGSLTCPERVMNTFRSVRNSKVTAVTIRKYIDCLEESFLLESARRYDIKGRGYIKSPKKYYFADMGLRNARINFRQFEETHCMENIIYNELRIRGYNVDVGVVPISDYDDKGAAVRKQLEVDFVCNLGSKRYYIQSVYSIPDAEKRRQETRPFSKIRDSFKKIIITGNMTPNYYDDNGVLTVNIFDFLLKENSLEL